MVRDLQYELGAGVGFIEDVTKHGSRRVVASTLDEFEFASSIVQPRPIYNRALKDSDFRRPDRERRRRQNRSRIPRHIRLLPFMARHRRRDKKKDTTAAKTAARS